MATYGMYGGGYGGGYGYGFAPTPGGFSPARTGAVESSPATPFEKTSGKLYKTEEGIEGSWIGAGVGAGAGAGLGALIGSHIKMGVREGARSGGRAALIGATLGGVTGIVTGVLAGKKLKEAEATNNDVGDDGKFNGSRRDDFQMDRTYQGVF